MKYSLEQIRAGLERHARREPAEVILSRGLKGVITAILNEICHSDITRRAVLRWCFPDKWLVESEISARDLTDSEWYALYCWVQPKRVMRNYWRGHFGLEEEISEILFEQGTITRIVTENIAKTFGLTQEQIYGNPNNPQG